MLKNQEKINISGTTIIFYFFLSERHNNHFDLQSEQPISVIHVSIRRHLPQKRDSTETTPTTDTHQISANLWQSTTGRIGVCSCISSTLILSILVFVESSELYLPDLSWLSQ